MATGRVPTTANSPLTAKGDLFTYSTTQARLAVGNDGDTLLADSSTTTGLRYNPQNALANPVINGGFDIWQRGTSIASIANVNYTADRHQFFRGAYALGATISRQTTGDTTNLPNIQYCARVQRDSGNTSTQSMNFSSSIETANALPFAGKTVTLSFYARKGANFSDASSGLFMALYSGTGTDQSITGTYTGLTTVASNTVTLTTSWQRFVITGTIASTATEIAYQCGYTPVGTAGAADYYEVTGVQIDLGTYTASTAPTFRRSGGTLQGELAACQRYFQAVEAGASYGPFGSAFAFSTNTIMFNYGWKVKMRTNPTVTYSAAADFATYDKDAAVTAGSTIGVERVNAEGLLGYMTVAGNPYAGGEGLTVLANAGASAKINASSEL